MMDILSSLSSQGDTAQFNFDSLLDAGNPFKMSSEALNTRAATASLMNKDPAQALQNYKLLATDPSNKTVITEVQNKAKAENLQSMLKILSDPKVDIASKQGVIRSFNSDYLSDPGSILHGSALSSPSVNETVENENSRLSTADMTREVYESRTRQQGLVNGFLASLDPVSSKTMGEVIDLYMNPGTMGAFQGSTEAALAEMEGRTLTTWDKFKNAILPGTTQKNRLDRLRSMSPSEQVQFMEKILSATSEAKALFGNENHYARFQQAVTALNAGGYSSVDEWIDNITPVLDMVGLGIELKSARKLIKGSRIAKNTKPIVDTSPVVKTAPKLDTAPPRGIPTVKEMPSGIYQINKDGSIDEIKRMELNYPVKIEKPAAPANIIADANPAKARELHAVLVKSESDELAQALNGVDAKQAVANNVYPQATTETGIVVSKPVDIERNLRNELFLSDKVLAAAQDSGGLWFSQAELNRGMETVVNDFRSADGMVAIDSMSSFSREGPVVKISAVYSLPEGGWLKAEDAYLQAAHSLRRYGIKEEDITILQKRGLDHVPIDVNDVKNGEGHFLVRIDTKHEIDPTNVGVLEKEDVKWNWMDRNPFLVSERRGSVTRHIFDAASIFSKRFSGAASVVSDKTSRFHKLLLEQADKFATQYNKLSKDRQVKVDDYIVEANQNRIKFDVADLKVRGFTNEEVGALREWKTYWDTVYYLENADLVKTLNSQGFQLFKNSNIEVYGKPIPKNQNIGRVYDPSLDSVVVHQKSEGDALYQAGGSYARLRRPVSINGELVEHIIVRNTPTEYLRKVRESDKVLNYIDGYYQVKYTAPQFVDELVSDASGRPLYWKAIAVAGDSQEATRFAKRIAASKGRSFDTDYQVRGDIKALDISSDYYWDIAASSGRIAQRHRGSLLEDASGINQIGDGSFVMNPVESAIRASSSISGRTVSRSMLETAKIRFMQQYGKYLSDDGMGGLKYPKNLDEIGQKGIFSTKDLADARTTWEYINYLENGYINSIDNAWKGLMNVVAEGFGKANLPKLERATRISSDVTPTNFAKTSTFTSYMVLNPLRQWIVQTHQSIRTIAYNPGVYLKGRMAGYVAEGIQTAIGVHKKTPGSFGTFLEKSGFLDAVDANSLIRGSLLSAADQSNGVIRKVSAPLRFFRKVGFDAGEQMNMIVHAAAVYDRYKVAGKNVGDATVMDEMAAEARALSYDMNFAGDMPYNQTSLAILLQFAQIPHKSLLQMTNRRIPADMRARLVFTDTLLWGTPLYTIGNWIGEDLLPENKDAREILTWGLESLAWNKMFEMIDGGETKIDFSSFAPSDVTGWGKFFQAMYSEGGLEGVILNSPFGSLWLKEGSRGREAGKSFVNATKSMLQHYNFIEDDGMPPETFMMFADKAAQLMSSGYANWQKAAFLLETRQKIDRHGFELEDGITKWEAWAQALGFGTADTRDMWRALQDASKDEKKFKEDVIKSYKDMTSRYAQKYAAGAESDDFLIEVNNQMLRMYANNPRAMKIIHDQWRRDMMGKESQLLGQMLRRANVVGNGDFEAMLKQAPLTEDQKEALRLRSQSMNDE